MLNAIQDDIGTPELPADIDLSTIANLADQEAQLIAFEVKHLAFVKQVQDKLRQLREIDIPNAMQEAGVRSFTTEDGAAITIKEIVKASITKAKRDEAHLWLRTHGFEAIIKNEISIPLAKGDDAVAEAVQHYLEDAGLGYKRAESVNYQTLQAFIREQSEAGNELPEDLFGIYRANIAQIQRVS